MEAAVEPAVFFFFSSRRRHTILQGDWSSDVCSSDLHIDTAPLVGTLSGQRIFENLLARLSLLGRWSRRRLSTMRLQWQMLWLVCTAVLAGVLPPWLQGIKLGERGMLPLSPPFLLLWAVGILCALGTAWEGQYHRLTPLVLLG